jgi:CheY-like chemotaxis protein
VPKKVIAWIDDDNEVLKPIFIAIENRYEIRTYHSYSEACASLAQIKESDLILMDLALPPGDNSTELSEQDFNPALLLGVVLIHKLGLHEPARRILITTVLVDSPHRLAESIVFTLVTSNLIDRDSEALHFKGTHGAKTPGEKYLEDALRPLKLQPSNLIDKPLRPAELLKQIETMLKD